MKYVAVFRYPNINGGKRRLRRSKGPGLAQQREIFAPVGVARSRPDKLRGFWHPNRIFRPLGGR